MVHQHFMQVPNLSVAENIMLGIEPGRGMVFDKKKSIQLTTEAAEKFQLHVDPNTLIRDLSVGYKQKVELLKALIRGVKVLILDEPTAVLTPQETAELFVQLKVLRDQGYGIIFISHKLEEVMELCDRCNVLRHGRVTGHGAVSYTHLALPDGGLRGAAAQQPGVMPRSHSLSPSVFLYS